MASSQWSASMLLVSLSLHYCTTYSTGSDYSTNLSALYREKRDLPSETREKVEKTANTVKDSLSLLNDVIGKIEKTKTTSVLKGLKNFVSLAPAVKPLGLVIYMALMFIPEEDPVLNEMKEGFAEVNSLSIQISNLATDVEWFNYASIYSWDEVCILNAWRKFNEFVKMHWLNNFKYLAEIFTNYYYTQAEASVINLYHYLTVNSTSLSENL